MRSVFTKIILFAVCLALCFSLAGCGSAKMETKQITAFNAPIDITAYGRHAEQGISDAAAAYTSMEAMIDPELETRPAVGKTISRIHRDTRFSRVLVLAARSPCSIMTNYFQTKAEIDEALP